MNSDISQRFTESSAKYFTYKYLAVTIAKNLSNQCMKMSKMKWETIMKHINVPHSYKKINIYHAKWHLASASTAMENKISIFNHINLETANQRITIMSTKKAHRVYPAKDTRHFSLHDIQM